VLLELQRKFRHNGVKISEPTTSCQQIGVNNLHPNLDNELIIFHVFTEELAKLLPLEKYDKPTINGQGTKAL
jgi:hypothetical protein